ncbi:MAG: DUF2490 domain-containing protein [Bacteroidales bacterium]|nr:DUF2490 domain-containing protein [Bacteroidales bacterium]
MKRLTAILAVMILAGFSATAQEGDDFGSWNHLQFNKAWKDASGVGGPYIGLRGEYRTKERFQATDIWFIRPAIGYRFNNWLKSDVSYDYCQTASGLQHKFLFSATGSLKSGPLSVSLREMYVRILSTYSGEWSNLLRSKLNVQYSFPDGGVKPYLAIEMFTWTKWINTRHFVGVGIPLWSHCSADLYYMYLTTAGTPQARHIAGLGFNFDL